MDVAEEGNILYKLNHARSRFTSGLISLRKNKKRHHLSMIIPPGNLKIYEAVLFVCLFEFFYGYNKDLPRYRKHSHQLPQLIEWKW